MMLKARNHADSGPLFHPPGSARTTSSVQPANGSGSLPRTPGLATNTAPPCGPPAPSWAEVVMNSWSRSAPPKAQALVCVAPSTSIDSTSRPLTGSRHTTRPAPPERDPQVPRGIDRHTVRRTTGKIGDDPHRTPAAVLIHLVDAHGMRAGVDEVGQCPVGGVHQPVRDEQVVEDRLHLAVRGEAVQHPLRG